MESPTTPWKTPLGCGDQKVDSFQPLLCDLGNNKEGGREGDREEGMEGGREGGRHRTGQEESEELVLDHLLTHEP